jgi:hypothetical protein
MKKLYSLAITSSFAFLLFSNTVSAQIYTAVRSGQWHVSSGPNIWDPNGEPPASCSGCTITLISGVTDTLNRSVMLSNNSNLLIGTNSALGGVDLFIPASGGTGFSSGFNILLDNTGGMGNSKIVLFDASASINAVSSGKYDGILSSNNGFLKLVGVAPGTFNADGSVQFSNTGIFPDPLFGPATLSAPGTLPVILSDFEATLNDNEVDLTWTTLQEINSDHFIVQRSVNAGANWANLGTVAANGNSAVAIHYSFRDGSPAAGTSEYRLVLVDRDGKFGYSDIKVVRSGLVSSVNVFPNPAKDYVNITLGSSDAAANLNIRLMSQTGQLLAEKKVVNGGGTTVTLAVSGYPQGNYLIIITGSDGTQQVSKLLISK